MLVSNHTLRLDRRSQQGILTTSLTLVVEAKGLIAKPV
jgi:hypothetical protein